MVGSITSERIDALTPWSGNARTHSKKQLRQIAASIGTFGFTNPVLIDEQGTILAGHGRVAAARSLGLTEVPCLRLEHMSPEPSPSRDSARDYISHDMLTARLILVGIGEQLSSHVTFYMRQTLKFSAPVRPGDTVHAEVQVIDID